MSWGCDKNSGCRNHRNGVISGSRNRRKGRQILYALSCALYLQFKYNISHINIQLRPSVLLFLLLSLLVLLLFLLMLSLYCHCLAFYPIVLICVCLISVQVLHNTKEVQLYSLVELMSVAQVHRVLYQSGSSVSSVTLYRLPLYHQGDFNF